MVDKTKTAKALRADYEELAKVCSDIQEGIRKKGPELQKEVEAKLNSLGLNLSAAIARKRAAFTAWEKARDAEAERIVRGPAQTQTPASAA